MDLYLQHLRNNWQNLYRLSMVMLLLFFGKWLAHWVWWHIFEHQYMAWTLFSHSIVSWLLDFLVVIFAVIEHAYSLGNATQKQTLLMELYSPELQLFKDLVTMKENRWFPHFFVLLRVCNIKLRTARFFLQLEFESSMLIHEFASL